MAVDHEPAPPRRHRPRAATVFIAAFVAGAAAAVGINRVLDVHLAQAKPQVECEPIFVALRSLPQGVPVTVWDVALRDWPKAMMPTAAVRVNDAFAGCLLKHPLREGQPLLTVQLLPPAEPMETPADEDARERIEEEVFVPPPPATVMAPQPAVTQPEPVAEIAEAKLGPSETVEPVPATSLSEPVAEVAAPQVAAVIDLEPSPAAAEQIPEAESTPPPPLTPEATAAVEATPAPSEEAPSQPAEQLVALPPPASDLPTPAAAEAVEPAGDTAAASSLVTVRQEPTPAAEPLQAPVVTAPAPVAIGPQLLGGRPDGDGFAPADLPSRPVTDIASLPSVMAREDAAPAETSGSTDASVRYLVVPERIAQQADTSFTTPAAPALADTADQRPVASKQAATDQQPTAGQAPARSGSARQAAARQPGSQPAMNRGSNRTATNRNPASSSKPSASQPKPADRAEAEPGGWGSMFPNVSAGLEAIGKWRTRGREAIADEPRPQPRR